MKYGIIGAGPTGMIAGMLLRNSHHIFEKNRQVGGHTSSFKHKGYTFDQGPHIMFSRNQDILDFMINSLGDNVHKCRRNNRIYFKGNLIKYPFENDLKSLPIKDRIECLLHFLINPFKKKYPNPENLEQWFLHHFGLSMCEKYFFPYNEKVWNIPISELSMLWSQRIPKPPAIDIIKSAIGYETEGYLHQLYYHYPLRGGYQAITKSWLKNVNITLNFNVTKIKRLTNGKYQITDGKTTYQFDKLVSTMPIHELVGLVNIDMPRHVKKAISDLIVNPMYTISLGIKGRDHNEYTAIYFPEADFLVNRVSFPKTFSPHNAPRGKYSIQAEITCSRDSSVWKKSAEFILNHTVEGLVARGIIKNKRDIVYSKVNRIPYAYVVYDKAYEKNTKIIRDWFPKQGIYLVGRFSYFEYINVDAVIERALDVCSVITGQKLTVQNLMTTI